MSSREPLPVCLVAMCVGLMTDKMLSVPVIVWGTLFLFLAMTWLRTQKYLTWFDLSKLCSERFAKRLKLLTSPSSRPLVSSLLLLCLVASGTGGWHHYYWNCFSPNDPGLLRFDEPTPVVIEGRIITSPRWLPAAPDDPGRLMPPIDQTVLTLKTTQIRNGTNWEPVNGRVSVSIGGKLPDLYYGDQVRIIGKLAHPNMPQNPGDYDQANALRQRRTLALLRANDAESVTLLKHASFSPGRQLERLRNSAHCSITKYMSPEHSTFAAAMILGVRDEVEPELTQMLVESGVAHIIAISGMHIGLIAIGLIWLLRLFGLRRKPLAIMLAITILCYLCITDMCPSAIRAVLLVFVFCLAIFRNQPRLQVNAFAATGILVLAFNPTNLFQLGTQLSFLATGVFLWFDRSFDLIQFFVRQKILLTGTEQKEHAIEEADQKASQFLEQNWFENTLAFCFRLLKRAFNGIGNTFFVSFFVWVIVAPLIVSQLHIFSPVALLINPLLWVPLMLALLSGFAVMIAGWFCTPLAALFGLFADYSYDWLSKMIAWFHSLPFGFFWTPGLPKWWLIGFYFPLIMMTLFPELRPKRRKHWRFFYIAMLVWFCVPVVCHHLKRHYDLRNDRIMVRVLAVGHGLCVHVKTPDGKALIFDVGCISSPYKSAQIAGNSLWDCGQTSIDALVISHPDSDHYNGVPHLLEKFSLKTACVTSYMFEKENAAVRATHDALIKHHVPITILAKGDTLAPQGFPMIRVLHPPPPKTSETHTKSDSNANSMVVLIEHRGFRIMLPGDMEAETRNAPFLQEPPVDIDVLVSPHHGSIKKSADDLIEWSTPEYLLISGGLFTYKPEAKTHFEQFGCTVENTLKVGMIEITIDKKGMRIEKGP